MIKNIYKGIFTSIVGVLLFGSGLSYVFLKEAPDYILMSILLTTGVAFLFFPDNIIKQLQNFTKRKSNEL